MADRPLAQCDVLRCEEHVHRVFDVSPPDRLRLAARLCYVHSEAINEGARWMWQGGGSRELGQAAAIAMGNDLPPLATSFRSTSGHFSNLGGTDLIRLELTQGDGTIADVEFELTPEIARNVGMWLGARYAAPPTDGGDATTAIEDGS